MATVVYYPETFKLQLMIIETDLERLNYIVRLYIRTRLSKLNKFTIFTSMKAVKMIIYCPRGKRLYTQIFPDFDSII